jgi:flagellar motor switch protein FliG
MTNPSAVAAVNRMSGLEKVATLMLTVGSEHATRVMELLNDPEREDVTRAVMELEPVDFDTQQIILAEFAADSKAHGHVVRGSVDYARQLLFQVHGVDADRILERLMAASASEPFMSLRGRDPEQIARVLNDESPQTIAVVLSYLQSGQASEILAKIDVGKQQEAAHKLATIDSPAPEYLAAVDESLRQQMSKSVQTERHQRRGGVKDLAHILNASDRPTERTILSHLTSEDRDLADRVRELMFVFEDLIRLSSDDLEKVLQGASPADMALSLKGVKGPLRDKVLEALSERMRTAVESELEVMKPRRASEVEAAQQTLVNRARELDEKQEITITRSSGAAGGGDMVQ